MKTRLGVFVALAFLVAGGAWQVADAAIINFDTTPGGAAIANGTVVDNTYSSLGVTFSSIAVNPPVTGNTTVTEDAVARAAGVPLTAPNVFGLVTPLGSTSLFDNRWGVGVATFSSGQSDVGIYAAAVPFVEGLGPRRAKPFLTAFDISSFLTAALYPLNDGDPNYGTFQRLVIHSPSANIFAVHFGSQKPSQFSGVNSIVYGEFDNLAFGTDVSNLSSSWYAFSAVQGPGAQPEPFATPEPATLLLLASGLILLRGAACRRRRM